MIDDEPRRGCDVADRARGRTDGERQFELGMRGCIVGFPTTPGFTMCQFAIQVVKNAFYALAVFRCGGAENEFVLMFWAGRRDYIGVFLDAPVYFVDTPPLLQIFLKMLDDSGKTNLYEKFADGVDGGRKDNGGRDVGWGKDAGRRSVGEGLDRALHGQGAGKLDGSFEIGIGVGAKLVIDASKRTVGCSGKMTREKVAEWETVFPSLVANRLGDENPLFDFVPLDRAIEAVFDGRFFEDNVPNKHHFKLFQHDFRFHNCEFELA